MKIIINTGILLLFVLSGQASATDWVKFNERLIDQQIIPSYVKFEKSALKFKKNTEQFCQQPDEASLKTLQAQWREVMSHWMNVQILRFGPIDDFMRHYRIQMWPDKRNTGGRQVSKALSKADRSTLKADSFWRTSVALQGLSASERLLFSNGVTAKDFIGADQKKFRCDLQKSIADNLYNISQGVLSEWQSGEESYKTLLLRSGQTEDSFFSSDKEVASYFLNNFYTQLQSIVDQKLLAPMGKDIEEAKGRKSESWRSKHSLVNIQYNLMAARSWYLIAFSGRVNNRKLDQQITLLFDQVINQSTVIKSPLSEAVVNPVDREDVERLLAKTRQLKILVASQLAPELDLPLGFNSLDGD